MTHSSCIALLPLIVVITGRCLAYPCPTVCHCSTHGPGRVADTIIDCSYKKLSPDILKATKSSIPKMLKAKSLDPSGSDVQASPPRLTFNSSYSQLKDDVVDPSYFYAMRKRRVQSIIMCCSNISTIESEAFKYAGAVGYLDLSRNRLTEVGFLKTLHTLVKLNLEYNSILMISVVDIRALDSLHTLKLRGNKLVSLSFLLMTLPSLSFLDVSDNFLKSITPHVFEGKLELSSVSVAENKVKIISYCLMLPFLNESSVLESFNMTHNPLYCGCHLVWLKYLRAENITHTRCAEPDAWRDTSDVFKLCPSNYNPVCGSGNSTHGVIWDPFATLAPVGPGAGKAKVTLPPKKPQNNYDAEVGQIVVLTVIGCIATASVVVALVKNRRMLRGKLDLRSIDRLSSRAGKSAVDEYRLSLADAEQDAVEMNRVAENRRHNLPGSNSWGSVQPGSIWGSGAHQQTTTSL